ncbi:MAG: guanylate kinase [Proteobacteria bacterium]|nr:guanylate kinase [Pseudomonadota bacterium]
MLFGKLFVISAPSGSGKTTLVQAILKDASLQSVLKQTITYTTRPPRHGEINGKDYHFISIDEFKEKIDENFFIEWSTWYDHYYGSPFSTLKSLKEGTSYLMVLDRLGAKDVLQTYPQAILIWINPPSIEELEKRLLARGDSPTIIKSRLQKASLEIQQEANEQLYKYHIVNDNFDAALAQLSLIIKKELFGQSCKV